MKNLIYSFLSLMLMMPLRAQMVVSPTISHLTSEAPPYTGAISLSVSGGSAPYSYTWTPGMIHTKDISNKAAGTYALKVRDNSGDSALFTWNIGYKVKWDQLFGATADDDSLRLISDALAGRGVSRNTLPGGADGWLEYVLDGMDHIKYIGFTDSLSPAIYHPGDMDYAFYYDGSSGYLYVMDHGSYVYAHSSALAGQVLRIGREGDTVSCYIDGDLVYSSVDIEGVQKDWKIKGHMLNYGNASFARVGCSFQNFGNSFFPGYLPLRFNVVHSSNSGMSDGSINVLPILTEQTYNYSWQPGMEKASGIVNRSAGNYSVTASDGLLHYSTRSCQIGYKVAWDSLKGARVSGDTLRMTDLHSWGRGMSRNKLPAGKDGWFEYILEGPEDAKFIGFVDSLSPYPDDAGDLDYGFYYQGGGWLYIYNGSSLSVVSSVAYPGMTLRIGRKGHAVYYMLDGIEVGFEEDSVLAARDWWIKGVGFSGTRSGFVNVGCSFSELIPELSLKVQREHATTEQPASGAIGMFVSGGVPPYRYFLNNKLVSRNLQTELEPGVYRVTVKDSLNDSLFVNTPIGLMNNWRLMRHMTLSDSGYVKTGNDSTTIGVAIAYNMIADSSDGFCELTVTESTNHTAFGFFGFRNGALNEGYTPPMIKEQSIDSLLVFADSLLRQPGSPKIAEAYQRLNLAYFKDGIVHIAFKDYSLAGEDTVTYAAGDVFLIQRRNDLIRLYKNNTLVATNAIAGNGSQILLNGVMLLKGRSLVYKNASLDLKEGIGNAFVPEPGCTEPALNWVKTRSFDENGIIKTETKAYMDHIGRPVQNQVKQFSKNNTLVSEPLYDSWGRVVGQSLAAPSFQEELCYVDHFIQRTAVTSYTPSDFDNLPGTGLSGDILDAFNALGDVNHPKPVYNGTQGKLGWYYSNNNTAEPLVAADELPYARLEYDDLGRIRRKAGVGTILGMGSGHETHFIYTSTPKVTADPASNELNYVFPYGTYELEKNFGVHTNNINHNLQLFKTISLNPDGRDQISYTNAAGQTIATCITGIGTGCVSHTEKKVLYPQSAREILQNMYVPGATSGTLRFAEEDGQHAIYATAAIPTLRDLMTNTILVSGTDYTYNNSTGYFTFTGNYAGRSLYLQATYSGTVTVGRSLILSVETEYTQWTLYFYDRKGRLLANTSPNSFQCQTQPSVVQRTATQGDPGYNCSNDRVASITLGNDAKNATNAWMYLSIAESASAVNAMGTAPSSMFLLQSDTARYLQDSLYFMNDTIVKDSLFLAALDTVLLPACMFPADSALAFYHNLDSLEMKVPVNALRGRGIRYRGEYAIYARFANDSLGAEPLLTIPYDFSVEGDGSADANGGAVLRINGYFPPIRDRIKLPVFAGEEGIGIKVKNPSVSPYGFGNDEPGLGACGESTHPWVPYPYHPLLDGITQATTPRVEIDIISWPTPINTPLANKYMYDEYDRLVGSISEDQGTVYYVYDQKEDKLLFTQNQKQRDNGDKFSCIVYDKLGRAVVSGEYDPANGGPTTGDIPFLFQDYYTWKAGVTVPGGRISTGSAALANSDAYNDGHIFERTFIEYDHADISLPATIGGTPFYYRQSHTAAKVSKTWNDLTTTWYSYDELGWQNWSVQQSAELGYKTMHYAYDLRGKLLSSEYQSMQTDNLAHYYSYDADERLSSVAYIVSSVGNPLNYREPLAAYEYYLHGPLKRAVLGNNLQGLDYVYTIDGKLKAMNNPVNSDTGSDPGLDGYSTGPHAAVSPDAFGYALEYYPGDYDRNGSPIRSYNNTNAYANNLSYTGLVKAQSWRTVLPAAATNSYSTGLMYEYQYDELYRLTGATFGTITETAPTIGNPMWSNTFTRKPEYMLENIDYDQNGNLQHLKRYAAPINSTTAHLLDNLTYHYDSGKKNKLKQIEDVATNVAGYSAELDLPDQPNSSNYVYNSIGELVENTQEDRGYEYNASGLVTRAYKLSNNHTIVTYTYNDKGLRHSKRSYISGSAVKDTYYSYDAGGVQVASYVRDLTAPAPATVLQDQTLYGGGRTGIRDAVTGSLLYELSDHLGNVRAVVKADNNGDAETVSYTDYYPHGGTLPGRTYQSSLNFPYGYQGQEKDNEVGLMNFELRQYDPRIGRWYNPDPYGQHHSPYLAMSNNPINFTDPDGGWDAGYGADDAQRDARWMYMSGAQNSFINGDADSYLNGLENMALVKNAVNDYRAKHTNEKGQWGNWITGDNVRGDDEEHKHFDIDESAKIVPTVYIYRVQTASDYNYKFEGNKTLSDNIIKQKIAPEVSRMLNNNWLNTKITVKVIAEEEAKLITSDFLKNNRSVIIPIVNGRDFRAPGSSIGQSTITKNGFVMTDPNETYVNYPAVLNFSRMLGLTKHYGSAYIIAHEVVHQLFGMSQTNANPYKDHTNGWANLNREGNEVGAQDFKTKSPFKSLKSMAEWIPFNMKQSINQWFKPVLSKP